MINDLIVKAPASRELDAEIAEKVMGGFVDKPDDLTTENKTWFWAHPHDGVLIGESYPLPPIIEEAKGMYSHQWRRFNPSTDISDAWLVVEKYRPVIHDFELTWDGNKDWSCHWWNDINDHYSAVASEAPLAICRAALLAENEHAPDA